MLTELGLETLRSASRIHLRGIKALFLDRISDEDLAVVERAMGSVIAGLTADDRTSTIPR